MTGLLSAVSVMDKAFYSDMITSIDQGLLGISLLIDPNFFWSPVTGLLANYSFVQSTSSTQDEFDTVTKLGLMGGGVILLSTLFYHLYFLHDARDERAFLRFKLGTYVAQILYLTRLFWLSQQDQQQNEEETLHDDKKTRLDTMKLAPKFFEVAILYKIILASWLVVGLTRIPVFQTGPSLERNERADRYNMTAVALSMAYALPYAILLTFWPGIFSQTGKIPFYQKLDELGNGTFNFIQDSACRFEGIHLFSTLVLLWDLKAVPLQIAEIMATNMILFAFVFQVGFTDTTGLADPGVFGTQLVCHVALTILILSLLFKSKSLLRRPEHQEQVAFKTQDDTQVPDLVHTGADEAKKIKRE